MYEFDFTPADGLLKRFDAMNQEWFDFVLNNRTKGGVQHGFDVVIGPVANDQTTRTINAYLKGLLDKDYAIRRAGDFKDVELTGDWEARHNHSQAESHIFRMINT